MLVFQFHKGTIKTEHFADMLANLLYFNSIKVRLKHASLQQVGKIQAFQFHKGTIKTSGYFQGTDASL